MLSFRVLFKLFSLIGINKPINATQLNYNVKSKYDSYSDEKYEYQRKGRRTQPMSHILATEVHNFLNLITYTNATNPTRSVFYNSSYGTKILRFFRSPFFLV